MPSAALTRRLKEREPEIGILFGGSGCDGEMGRALMELFPEVDVVLQGEAETTFLPVIEAMRHEIPFSKAKNCIYRDGGRIFQTNWSNDLSELDDIPLPDYKAYMEQRKQSPYINRSLILAFETSRGCWWGQKQQCLFCGIRANDLTYRERSPQSAFEQIASLVEEYAPDLLYATDCILKPDYCKTVLPQLAGLRREKDIDTELFYEIKSNTRREQMAILSAAGVKEVQPGIESLSTNVLRAMRKGSTGLHQIELLKWAQTYGIRLIYSIITGVPGEHLEDYNNMVSFMSFLHHLPPPVALNRLAFHRFSPYAAVPSRYGFKDIRPFPVQRIIYRTTNERLMRLCYELEYQLEKHERPEMKKGRKRLSDAMDAWKHDYLAGERLVMKGAEDTVIITRRSAEGNIQVWPLRGSTALVYTNAQSATSFTQLSKKTGLSVSVIAQIIERMAKDRLVIKMDDHCLALAVQIDVDLFADAGLKMNRNPENTILNYGTVHH